MEFKHIPIMAEDVIEQLNIRPDGIYVDGTTGGGGHSFLIAQRLTSGHLYCFDRDAEAIAAAGRKLATFSDKVSFIRDNFGAMVERLSQFGVRKVNGILLDLGVSSYQIDNGERGFSYMQPDAPLDMRMDQSGGETAADILNTYSEEDLAFILKEFGEERYAKRIASAIVKERAGHLFFTAEELNAIITKALPARALKGGHPSKRTYQALRIAVNDELNVLEKNIDNMIGLLADGGRMCVITFHSLEDRIVKNAFRTAADPCICPKDFPVCVCGRVSQGRVVTRKPITADEEEIEKNSRSKSAKLRVFERSDHHAKA